MPLRVPRCLLPYYLVSAAHTVHSAVAWGSGVALFILYVNGISRLTRVQLIGVDSALGC